MSTYRHAFSSLAAAARRPTRPSGSFRLASVTVRNVHQLQQLPYSIENGLGGFLTPEALRVIAVDYQNGLLERLNDEVRGAQGPFLLFSYMPILYLQERNSSI